MTRTYSFTFLAFLFLPVHSYGAPGNLSDSPLYLKSSVEPNIVFLADDSGSMDSDMMTSFDDGIYSIRGPNSNSSTKSYWNTFPVSDNAYESGSGSPPYHNETAPTQQKMDSMSVSGYTGTSGVWRLRNSDFSKTYYDPTRTYSPWSGVNQNGNAYTNVNPSAALIDPYLPSGSTINLTTNISYRLDFPKSSGSGTYILSDSVYPARYYTWTDTDSDGFVDSSDGHTLIEIKSSTTLPAKASTRTDCLGDPCTYNEEIQNFANWFSYHRRREFAAKNAISQVVSGLTNARVGYGTINNNQSNIIGVASMNASPSSGTKKTLLDNVFKSQAFRSTPLRINLRNVGRYFACESGNFFAASGSSCPILSLSNGGNCQRNFALLMTDGFYNGSSPSLSPSNTDQDSSSSEWDGPPYADSYSNTLADVAMHYYETDLSSLSDDVPAIVGVDEATHQHMVTYTIAFGVSGTLDPFGDITPGVASDTDPNDSGFSWPNPTAGSEEKIDDLWHAAFNGRGDYFNASNPEQLTNAIETAVKDATEQDSTAAPAAFNSTSLDAGSELYQVRFNNSKWSGEMFSYPLNATTGDISTTASWEASNVLDNRNISVSPRVMITKGSSDGVAFTWANLTLDQKKDLCVNLASCYNETDTDDVNEAKARLDYLRGSRSNESSGYNFRVRDSRLGDIVHSAPVYIGKPALFWPSTAPFPTASGDTYTDFQATWTNRNPVVYVGANDGMLHGFRASDGEEVIAYLPSYLFSTGTSEGYHYLSDDSYIHKYYVDLTPAISDVYTKTNASETDPSWNTVLVGSQRGGGRGLFALDITDPSIFSESGIAPASVVMWEFDDTDDADLGYLFGEPILAMTNDVVNGNNRWAAIFGNGYNSSDSGDAVLFIVFLDGGLDGVWTDGSSGTNLDYVKITTGVGTSSDKNGLSPPAIIDLDGNGTADRVYAGDLEGNMWVFNLSDSDTANWRVAFESGGVKKPLFTGSTNQAITVRPTVVNNKWATDSLSDSVNRLVLFGTGQYLVDGDLTTTDTQSFYGVWDNDLGERTRSHLVAQTFLSNTFIDNDGDDVTSISRVLSNNAVNYIGNSPDYGWRIDLPTSGERVVVDAVARGENLFFNTTIPNASACDNGGSGVLMVVSQQNGGRPEDPAFDFNGDGVVDENDRVRDPSNNYYAVSGVVTDSLPTRSSFLSDTQYTGDSNGNMNSRKVEELGAPNTGRISWIELGRD